MRCCLIGYAGVDVENTKDLGIPIWMPCNAPTGGVRPDVGERDRLLGKSMEGSYGEPSETTRAGLYTRRFSSGKFGNPDLAIL